MFKRGKLISTFPFPTYKTMFYFLWGISASGNKVNIPVIGKFNIFKGPVKSKSNQINQLILFST